MTNNEFENILANDQRLVENSLPSFLPSALNGQDEVVEAMKYSLTNGGKRLRPVLTLEFCKACGGDRHDAIEAACAVEFIHTYSLIHDDLPCMDNDDYRRGKPSCHKEFSEDIALLAGDGLLTHAFQIISDSDMSDSAKAKAVSLLAENAGIGGMLGGQVLDLKYEIGNPTVKELLTVHKMKTGALIAAACIMGCIAAGADSAKIAAASRFAYYIGIAFQIKDDILDVVGSSDKLGKPIGSDADNNKTTYVTKVGLTKAQSDVELLTQKGLKELEVFDDSEFISMLADRLINRDH